MALSFLNKKIWHPGSFANMEKTWVTEQKYREVERRAIEKAKKIKEEKVYEEMKKIQVEKGLIPAYHLHRLDFMYQCPQPDKADNKDETEDFLLGKRLDDNEENIYMKRKKKIVPKSSKCINDCAVTSYPYEYSGKCYKNCPFGTILDNYICKEQIKLDNLNPVAFKDLIKEKIYSYADSSNIMNGLNFVAIISSSDEINPEEQIKNGISAFEFGNCINDLKVHYSIPKDENLIILNMEIQNQKNESNNNDND